MALEFCTTKRVLSPSNFKRQGFFAFRLFVELDQITASPSESLTTPPSVKERVRAVQIGVLSPKQLA